MRRLAKVLAAAAAIGSTLAAIANCGLVTSYDCFSAPCSGADAGFDAPPAPGCVLARPPSAPIGAPAIFETTNYTMLATELSLELPEGDAGADGGGGFVGVDLDNTCTCQPSAKPDPSSCVNARALENSLCDEFGGSDRQMRKLLQGFGFQVALGDNALRDAVKLGRIALLVQLSGYNGQANDGQVRVDLFNAELKTVADDAGAPTYPQPKLDETDNWLLDRTTSTVTNPATKLAASVYFSTGYVRDNVLVAGNFAATVSLAVRFENGGKVTSESFDLVNPIVVGTIVPEGSGFKISRGFIAAKWPMVAALRVFQSGRFCSRDPVYETIRTGICGGADLATKPGNLTSECDAISFTMAFSSRKAKFLDLGDPSPRACPNAKADDCTR
jgi:hypothetical protein